MRELVFLRDDVEVADVLAALQRLGYAPGAFVDATAWSPFEIQFQTTARACSVVTYIDDRRIGVAYLLVEGPEAANVRGSLEDSLHHYDRGLAYQRAASDPDLDERVTALFHLALSRAPAADPDVVRLVGEFLRHDEARVRGAAVLVIAYFEWPELAPLLDELILREGNPRIVEHATLLRCRLA